MYYAELVLANPTAVENDQTELRIDCRPSDGIALASRVNAPIFVEEEVMNRMGTVVVQNKENDESELEEFDKFVQTLSPDDF